MVTTSMKSGDSLTHEEVFFSVFHVIGFLLLFFILLVNKNATTILEGLLLLCCLKGGRVVIYGMLLTVIVMFLNPTIYQFTSGFGVLARLMIILGSARLLLSANLRHWRCVGSLFLFVLVVALLSPMQNNNLIAVSLAKLFLFAFGASSLLIAFAGFSREDLCRIRIWTFSLLISIAIASVPTYFFTDIGFAKNGVGFQGIMNHPQTFGPLFAPLAAWLITSPIYLGRNRAVVRTLTGGILIGFMVVSQARTSIAALAIGIVIGFVVVVFRRRPFKSVNLFRSIRMAFISTALIGAIALSSDVARDTVVGFIFKRQADNIEEAIGSRSAGIASQWDYFFRSPIVGNGFGVYAWGEIPHDIVEVLGIPLSAPVEKGFLPTAILEETGILGTTCFIIFLVFLGIRVVRTGDPQWTSVFICSIAVNVGEVIFFSVSGIGLIYWVMIAQSTVFKEVVDSDTKQVSPRTKIACDTGNGP